jgi:hypothetical protein
MPQRGAILVWLTPLANLRGEVPERGVVPVITVRLRWVCGGSHGAERAEDEAGGLLVADARPAVAAQAVLMVVALGGVDEPA